MYSTFDIYEKSILRVLKEHKKLRYLELSKIVIKENKSMSDRTFRERLEQLVEKGIVFRNELSRQIVNYSLSEINLEKEANINQYFENALIEIKIRLEHIEKNSKKITIMDQADAINLLMSCVSMLEQTYLHITYKSKSKHKKEISEIQEKIEKIVRGNEDLKFSVKLLSIGNITNSLKSIDEIIQIR